MLWLKRLRGNVKFRVLVINGLRRFNHHKIMIFPGGKTDNNQVGKPLVYSFFRRKVGRWGPYWYAARRVGGKTRQYHIGKRMTINWLPEFRLFRRRHFARILK